MWVPVYDPETGIAYDFEKVCYGCDDYSFCDSPLEQFLTGDGSKKLRALGEPLMTPCIKWEPDLDPIPDPDPIPGPTPTPDSARARMLFKSVLGPKASTKVRALAAEDKVAFLRVPDVSNPVRWSTSRLIMNSFPFTITDSGWKVVFIKTPGPAVATVTPPLTPTTNLTFNSKVLSAYVILPENGVATQYWVNVSNQLTVFGKNHSILQTPNWTVLFYRDPMP